MTFITCCTLRTWKGQKGVCFTASWSHILILAQVQFLPVKTNMWKFLRLLNLLSLPFASRRTLWMVSLQQSQTTVFKIKEAQKKVFSTLGSYRPHKISVLSSSNTSHLLFCCLSQAFLHITRCEDQQWKIQTSFNHYTHKHCTTHTLATNIYQNVISLKACICYLLGFSLTGYMCVLVCVHILCIHQRAAFAQAAYHLSYNNVKICS